MSWWWPKPRLARLAHIEGLEHLQAAQREGQGAILMAVHFTTLEIGAALLGQAHTIDGMYREHGNPLFDYIQRRGRERHNLDSLAVERDDVRGMLKLLRGGRAIWYAPDGTTAPSRASSCRCSAFRPQPSRRPPSSPAWARPGDPFHPEAPGGWQRLSFGRSPTTGGLPRRDRRGRLPAYQPMGRRCAAGMSGAVPVGPPAFQVASAGRAAAL